MGFAELIFIAVGTPPDEDGSADLKHVLAVAGTIGRLMQSGKVVINKSTVPVGTANQVHQHIAAILAERGVDLPSRWSPTRSFSRRGRGGRLPAAGSHHHRHRLGPRHVSA